MAEYTPLPLHNDIEQPPSLQPPPAPPPMNVAGKSKTTRVASLDVFRGLCVFLMMVVDYGGSIYPSIAHAPWNGLNLADLVMPFFLFIAGLSLAIAYKKVGDKMDATKKAISRAAKLFVLGVFLQGGYLHGAKSLTYGVDILRIRWMGILQRISIAYLVAALCEIWLPCQKWKKFGIIRSYFWQWCLALLMSSLYIGLLYGLHVPDWEINMSNSGLSLPAANGTNIYKITSPTMQQDYSFLADLTDKPSLHRVKVRVIEKSRPFQSPGKKKYQRLVLQDMQGSIMKVTLFEDDIAAYDTIIKQNLEYIISNATIKPVDPKYQTRENEYQMTINNRTIIQPTCTDSHESVPQCHTIASLPRMANTYDRFDILGIVIYVSEAWQVKGAFAQQNSVCDIFITDHRNHCS